MWDHNGGEFLQEWVCIGIKLCHHLVGVTTSYEFGIVVIISPQQEVHGGFSVHGQFPNRPGVSGVKAKGSGDLGAINTSPLGAVRDGGE